MGVGRVGVRILRRGNESDIDIKAMKILKDAGADLDANCSSPLIFMAARNSLKLVKELLKMGADPQVQDNDYHQSTLLSTVIRSNRYRGSPEEVLEVVKAIIKRYPEAVNKADKRNETPLISAVRWRFGSSQEQTLEIVKVLVHNGADVNAVDDRGYTPLMDAAWSSYPAVVKLLLEKNADVNAQDKDEHTALMILLDARNNTNSLDTAKIL